ncbi:MAG: hypothetical protein EZS28_009230 [Streblomastix strix]|uniref:Uncharacterized protein n=1 Tax=Streblomastix strix TaxID=222440 RepID=A0A5J4WLN5_9EUKA|nr:MAG: hypothetical protein EZS28_009230 [Streblomastix strix]
MSSNGLEPNNGLFTTTFQQSTAKIHVYNKRTLENSNRCSQSTVLKKIREEQIEVMIIAPLRPGQIWSTELVNENVQSLNLYWSNEILEQGTSLIKKNLKLPPSKICCILMDRRPEWDEDLQERFLDYLIYPREQQI